MRNERGQMVVEAVLLIVVFFGVLQIVSQSFKDNELIREIVETPYNKIKNMAQNGNWITDPQDSMYNHPMHLRRHISTQGADVQ